MSARGTTNSNVRGSATSRRVRKAWLVECFRANVDVIPNVERIGDRLFPLSGNMLEVPLGEGQPACRCFRCGDLLTKETVTVDRVLCGIEGGRYRRENIRPACGPCNSSLGGTLAAARRRR